MARGLLTLVSGNFFGTSGHCGEGNRLIGADLFGALEKIEKEGGEMEVFGKKMKKKKGRRRKNEEERRRRKGKVIQKKTKKREF